MANPNTWDANSAIPAIVIRLKMLSLRLARIQLAKKAKRAVTLVNALATING